MDDLMDKILYRPLWIKIEDILSIFHKWRDLSNLRYKGLQCIANLQGHFVLRYSLGESRSILAIAEQWIQHAIGVPI